MSPSNRGGVDQVRQSFISVPIILASAKTRIRPDISYLINPVW